MRLTICLGLVWFLSLGTGVCRGQSAEALLRASGVQAGLIVHLDCGDGALTAEFSRSGQFLVRGLTQGDTAAARRNITEKCGYGRVSVGEWDGKHVAFMDNLVNLLVTNSASQAVAAEIARVLAPRGVALVKGTVSGLPPNLESIRTPGLSGWTKLVKKVPSNIDEWTHWLHGPGNNAVAKDEVVGPPGRLQWIADPLHLRSHEHLNSISALVSAGGRIFYIIDEGPTSAVAAPTQWRVVARDAFNGLLLWKRDIGPWEGHFRLFRSGPPAIARRLVAVGNEVYVTLGYGKKVAGFEATTGKTLRMYDKTEGALEIVCDQGRLYVVVGNIDLSPPADPKRPFDWTPHAHEKGIVALEAGSGKVLWERRDQTTAELMPTTLAISGSRVCFQNTKQVVCLDVASGKDKWAADRPVYTRRLSWSAPVLVVSDDVVLSADGSTGKLKTDVPKGTDRVEWILSDADIRKHPVGDVVAFDADTGDELWTDETVQGFCNPGDLFVIDGKVWAGADVGSGQVLLNTAVDIRTGEVVSRRPDNGMPVAGHTRCYRNKATERFLILGDVGVDFMNTGDWSWNANSWVRGTCQYGVMPCNGLLYVPSDSCACRPEMRLHGFSALTTQPAQEPRTAAAEPLYRGPAYAAAQNQEAADHAWPTYRGDAARTGFTPSAVPSRLQPAWEAKLGGKLSSLTIGTGKVFVAQVDAHRICVLDLATGKNVWTRTVGGRVDSPPTLWRGLAIFGCHDGFVYCLDANDGELVWRFRAAPEERSLVAMEHLESAWPVNGSVLIKDGRVWFVSGRSSYLDGGLRLWALDPASGKAIVSRTLDALGPQTFRKSKGSRIDVTPPTMPDILSASNGLVYMRWMGFDAQGQISRNVKPHLFSATGFLDDTWWHRTYWQYGTWMSGGFGGWPRAGNAVPAGRIMAASDNALFSYGRTKYDAGNGGNVHAGHIGLVKRDYQDGGEVAAAANPYKLFSTPRIKTTPAAGRKKTSSPRPKRTWDVTVPMLVRGMVLADKTLFVAGPPAGQGVEGLAKLTTIQPGILWAVSCADGKKLSERKLPASPVLDGMAVAPNRLLFTCTDGTVRCLTGK
ncbi:MAG: outer membrane protein assembly factor BamB family protein [Planctomycetota bacterium]|jgi:outer membrane protein assembly factor BamB